MPSHHHGPNFLAGPAIEFAGVTKVYHRRFRGMRVPALSNISFQVVPGEVCAFLGPNGAGKTTSMNVLMGFIYADSGISRVFGYEPGDVRAKQSIGFLPENFAFYHYLNAEKLLQFHLRLSGRQLPDPATLIASLLAKVKLDSYKGLKIGKYSRGMVQRLGIAQALLGDPELLVLDEPTSGLDPAGRKEVRHLILALKAEGKTIFLSSHILSEVEQICDRVIIIDRGHMVHAGTMQQMLAEDNRAEIIVDQLPENLELVVKDSGASIDREPHRVRIVADVSHKRALAEMLWAAGCDVLSLTPLKTSLEATFLKRPHPRVSPLWRVVEVYSGGTVELGASRLPESGGDCGASAKWLGTARTKTGQRGDHRLCRGHRPQRLRKRGVSMPNVRSKNAGGDSAPRSTHLQRRPKE